MREVHDENIKRAPRFPRGAARLLKKNNVEFNEGKRLYRLLRTKGAFIICCPKLRTCSRNQACAGSSSSRWCHIMS
jgi:hypothetical protein